MTSRCTLAGITVQFAEGGRSFAIGDEIDLDARVSTALPWLTWRDALGRYADEFVDADPEPDQEY